MGRKRLTSRRWRFRKPCTWLCPSCTRVGRPMCWAVWECGSRSSEPIATAWNSIWRPPSPPFSCGPLRAPAGSLGTAAKCLSSFGIYHITIRSISTQFLNDLTSEKVFEAKILTVSLTWKLNILIWINVKPNLEFIIWFNCLFFQLVWPKFRIILP